MVIIIVLLIKQARITTSQRHSFPYSAQDNPFRLGGENVIPCTPFSILELSQHHPCEQIHLDPSKMPLPPRTLYAILRRRPVQSVQHICNNGVPSRSTINNLTRRPRKRDRRVVSGFGELGAWRQPNRMREGKIQKTKTKTRENWPLMSRTPARTNERNKTISRSGPHRTLKPPNLRCM